MALIVPSHQLSAKHIGDGVLQTFLRRTCNADEAGALFIPRPCPDRRHLLAIDGSFLNAGVEYFTHWMKEDPWLLATRRQGTNLFTRAGEVRFGHEFITDEELHRTAYYNDFGRRCGGGQKIVLKICDDDDQLSPAVTLSLNRSFGKTALGTAERDYLRALWKPLQNVMHHRWRLRRMTNAGEVAAHDLNNLPHPTLVLRIDASVDFANDQAQNLMRSVPWLKVAGNKVCQVGDLDLSELAAAVRSAPSGTAQTWLFGYGENGTYRCGTMRLISIAPESSYAICWPQAHALLFIDMPDKSIAEPRIRKFASRYQLTSREQEILDLAINRIQLSGIAERLGISQGTVRVHLSNIYEKTNCHSIADVVNIVMSC